MPMDISPRKVQEAAHQGHRRLQNFRNSRLLFLRSYVGQYYDKASGEIGQEPLNSIFTAIRTLVPNIVMNFPQHNVESRFLASQDYADLLGMALSYHDKQTKIKDVYQQAIVDAIFTLGILKTGIADSESVYVFDEHNQIDTGDVYSECVDFDDLVVDPHCRQHLFKDARFIGDRIIVPRAKLLDSGLYKNDLIEQLPRVGEEGSRDVAEEMSKRSLRGDEYYSLEDEVAIMELWFPGTNTVATIPSGKDLTFDDYLRVHDYYGPSEGPYTFLAITPPVPGNPLPVPLVGIWNDLHLAINRMAAKTIDQADRQKDLVAYKRSSADDAIEAQDASDGEAIAMDDPDGVRVISYGGQQQSNEIHLAQLQNWFNQMAANPQALAGQQFGSGSATEAKLMQGNASVGLEHMRDLVYIMSAEEARKRAWYFHTDPMIKVPLIKREQVPAEFGMDPVSGQPMMLAPPTSKPVQVFLEPEARNGEWLDFTFTIEPESMTRMDAAMRLRQSMDFATKILPAAVATAQQMMMLGVPFDIKKYITKMAKQAGIDWLDQVFLDPEFQERMMMVMMMGPDPAASQGKMGGGPNPGIGANPLAAIMQNGQPGGLAGGFPSPDKMDRQQAQSGANAGQADLRGAGGIV